MPTSLGNIGLNEFGDYPRDVVEWVLSNRSLETEYQKIIRHENNEVFGFEALSRPHVKQMRLRPDSWFKSASEHALAPYADYVAIENALRSLSFVNFERDFLCINVMPASLIEKEFPASFERLLREMKVPPSRVVLEIVEFSSSSQLHLRESVELFRSFGVRIALDDMGAGLSNLNRLIDLRPDFVKVDRSLIQGIAVSLAKQRLLSLLVQFMNRSDSVIAEGIETREDLETVIQCGVQLSQGFYWGRPSASFEKA